MDQRLAHFEGWFKRWSTPAGKQLLSDAGLTLVSLPGSSFEDETWDGLAGAHGYQIPPGVELRAPWYADRRLIEQCPSLVAVCTTGSGYDVVDVDACTNAGILVCNQAGENKEAVAEHAVAMMLSLSKKVGLADRMLRRGADYDLLELRGNNLQGATLGVIGLSHIGTRLAYLCRVAFGMRVLAFDPYVDAGTVEERHAEKVEFEQIFADSDFVSVHCALNAQTAGMIGRREFELMKPTAFFISTARGGIHDEQALDAALREGQIAGAGLDVFETEPPPSSHSLLQLDNVIATPHIAGMTEESIAVMAKANASQWLTLFRGEEPPRLVNACAWSRYTRRFEEMFGFRPQATTTKIR